MEGISTFRRMFNPLFEEFVENKLSSYARIAADDSLLEILAYVKQMLLSGGKRIRPFFAYIGYKLVRDDVPESVFKYFFALECFHTFALIHDDIMDQGQRRHGISTAHVYLTERLRNAKRTGDLIRVGESQAILLGDLLHAWSNELLMERSTLVSEGNFRKMHERYAQMIDELVVGQMLDIDLTTRVGSSFEVIERKMRLKTAGYAFEKPLQIGAQAAGGSDELLESLGRMGRLLGIGFQIQDDFLDLTQMHHSLNKTVFSDLSERQHTVFTQWIIDHGTESQKRALNELLGERLTEDDRRRISELFEDSGSFRQGKALMDKYFDETEQVLEEMDVSVSSKQLLKDAILYIRQRTF